MQLEMKNLTKKSISSTQKKWKEVTGPEVFELELKNVFEIVSSHINYDTKNDNATVVYGIFNIDTSEVEAFVEVVQTKKARGGITKMLKLWISPSYWDVDVHKTDIAEIYIAAMNATISLGSQEKHKLVKIYGRNDYMMVLLNVIYNKVSEVQRDGKLENIRIYFEGRWLTFAH